jgi:hypothetical protein
VKDFPLNKALPLYVPGKWRFSAAGKLLASPDSDACDVGRRMMLRRLLQ